MDQLSMWKSFLESKKLLSPGDTRWHCSNMEIFKDFLASTDMGCDFNDGLTCYNGRFVHNIYTS